jgi:hypothetical protein
MVIAGRRLGLSMLGAVVCIVWAVLTVWAYLRR